MPIPFNAILAGAGIGSSILGGALSARAQGNALRAAGQAQQQASNQAINATLQLFDLARADLAPFRQLLPNALPALESLTFTGKLPEGGFTPTQFSFPGEGQSGAGNAGFGGNAFSSIPGANFFGLPQDVTNAINPNIPPGTTAQFGSGGPVVPGLFNQRNASKTEATVGIDQLGILYWGEQRDGNGGLSGAVKQGRISPEEALQAATFLYQSWQNAMQAAGVMPDIIQSSVRTQPALRDFENFIADFNAGSFPAAAKPPVPNLTSGARSGARRGAL